MAEKLVFSSSVDDGSDDEYSSGFESAEEEEYNNMGDAGGTGSKKPSMVNLSSLENAKQLKEVVNVY